DRQRPVVQGGVAVGLGQRRPVRGDRDGHRGRRAGGGTVGGAVREGVQADVAAGRGVAERAVGLQRQRPVGGAGDELCSQWATGGGSVVAQHPGRGDVQGRVLPDAVEVVVRRRPLTARGERHRDGRAVVQAVKGPVGETVLARKAGGGGV